MSLGFKNLLHTTLLDGDGLSNIAARNCNSTLTSLLSVVCRNIEEQHFALQCAGHYLFNPRCRGIDRNVNIGLNLKIKCTSVNVKLILTLRQHNSVLLRLSDRNLLGQIIGLISKYNHRRTLIVARILGHIEIEGIGRHSTGRALAQPLDIIRQFNRNIDIALDLDSHRASLRTNHIFAFRDHDRRLRALLIDRYNLLQCATRNGYRALTLVARIVLGNIENQRRGFHRTGSLVLDPALRRAIDRIAEINIRLDLDSNRATLGRNLKLRRRNSQGVFRLLGYFDYLLHRARFENDRGRALIGCRIGCGGYGDLTVASCATRGRELAPIVRTIVEHLCHPIARRGERNILRTTLGRKIESSCG